MRRWMLTIAILLPVIRCVGSYSPLHAAGTSSAQFLTLGAGARAASMGDAYCSVSDDATATFWNPAGLSNVKNKQMSFTHNSYLENTSYQYMAGAIPFEFGTFGAFIQRMDFGTLDRYSATDIQGGSFNAASTALGLSTSKKVSHDFMFGINLKLIQEKMESESASSVAGDFGLLYRYNKSNIGFSLQNVGPGLKFVSESNPLPTTLRLGISRAFFDESLLGSADIVASNDSELMLSGGLEYKLTSTFMVRGGYKLKPGESSDLGGLTNVNGGFGILFNRFNLDYSFSPFGDLGSAHRLSFLVHFSN